MGGGRRGRGFEAAREVGGLGFCLEARPQP